MSELNTECETTRLKKIKGRRSRKPKIGLLTVDYDDESAA